MGKKFISRTCCPPLIFYYPFDLCNLQSIFRLKRSFRHTHNNTTTICHK